MRKIKGEVALVTGSSRGIGKGIALRLAEEDVNIAINYLTDDQEADAMEVKEEIERLGQKAFLVKGDVGSKEEVTKMVSEVEKNLGNIDILVNNAGISPFQPFLQLTEEAWDLTYQTNVKSIFLTSQAVAKGMIERGHGKIINIASTASLLVTSPVVPHYISSKAAAHQLTKALAIELGKYNINVNSVGPSTVETELTKEYLADPEIYKQEIDANPMRRLGTARQIGDAVTFLASEDAMQINGHLLMVDGGLTVKAAQPEDHLEH